jgi:hypothetical protein
MNAVAISLAMAVLVNGQALFTNDYPQSVQWADGTIVVVSHVGSDDAYGARDPSSRVQTFRLTEEPEPSPITIAGTGVLVLLAYRWQRHRRAL